MLFLLFTDLWKMRLLQFEGTMEKGKFNYGEGGMIWEILIEQLRDGLKDRKKSKLISVRWVNKK